MKDLRERAENLFGRGGKFSFWGNPGREQAIKDVEAEFREIRNEALEEAAKISDQAERDDVEGGICSWVSDEVRKLKTHALAAGVNTKEVENG